MNNTMAKATLLTAAITISLAIVSLAPAHATTKWVGAQPATISGGDPFSISLNTITVSQAATPTFLDIDAGGAERLLGIDGLWIVSPTGKTIAGVSSSPTGSSLTGTSPATTWVNQSGPAGYAGDNGFAPGKNWMTLASASTISSFGASASGYDLGVFTFAGLSTLPAGYSLGVDYIVGSGTSTSTGRAFFNPNGLPSPPDVVPESNASLLMLAGLVPLALFGLLARRKQSSILA